MINKEDFVFVKLHENPEEGFVGLGVYPLKSFRLSQARYNKDLILGSQKLMKQKGKQTTEYIEAQINIYCNETLNQLHKEGILILSEETMPRVCTLEEADEILFILESSDNMVVINSINTLRSFHNTMH